MKRRKWFGFILVLLYTLSLTGCWNYREIETMFIVSGIAVDKGTQNKYHVTYQYLVMQGDSQGGSTKPTFIEEEGDTLFEATRNAIRQTKNKLYFGDCKVFIVSEELAKEGVNPLLDWFSRDAETRITAEMIVSREQTAGEVLQQKPDSTDIAGFVIDQLVENNPVYLGKSVDVAIYQAEGMLMGKGISLTLPAVEMLTTLSDKVPAMDGTAIFKKDRLIGFLDDQDSRSLLFIKDQLKGGLIVTGVNKLNKNIALEIRQNKTAIKPVIANDKITMKIKIQTKVSLGEEIKIDSANPSIEEIQSSTADTIKTGVEQLIRKMQTEYNSDIFGFGSRIYQNQPQYWKEHGSEWDSLFPAVKADVTVEVQILDTATEKLKTEG